MVGIIRHPHVGVLLFDTGYDTAFLEATRRWPERLYRLATPVDLDGEDEWGTWLSTQGLAASDIAGVIISHFHGDHVAGLGRIADVPVYCARAGLERVRSGGRFRRVTQGLLSDLAPPSVERRARYFEDAAAVPLPPAFDPFETGRDLLGDGSLIAVELPGHCHGHWGLALRTETDRDVLLAADATWSERAIRSCTPPPRLTTALLGETHKYRETLSRLHQATVRNPSLAILPSHCAVAANAFRQTDGL